MKKKKKTKENDSLWSVIIFFFIDPILNRQRIWDRQKRTYHTTNWRRPIFFFLLAKWVNQMKMPIEIDGRITTTTTKNKQKKK